MESKGLSEASWGPIHNSRGEDKSLEKLEDAHPQTHIRLWGWIEDGEHSHSVGTISAHLQPGLDLL